MSEVCKFCAQLFIKIYNGLKNTAQKKGNINTILLFTIILTFQKTRNIMKHINTSGTNIIDEQNTNESDYIVIPNPIYDVVFKYLMEDNQSAKIIISTLIKEKI